MENKISFQVSGSSPSGAITAKLVYSADAGETDAPASDAGTEGGGNAPKTEFELEANGAPLVITKDGYCVLELAVPGFGPLKQPLIIDLEAEADAISFAGPNINGLCLLRARVKDAMSNMQGSWLYRLNCSFGHARELVLVAGADTSHTGTLFAKFADTRRIDQMYRRHKTHDEAANDNTIVTQFHFETGHRYTFMLCDKGQEQDLQPEDRWMVVDSFDHGKPEVKQQRPDGLSITHVYDWIIAAGKQLPGRIVELSFFSHGFSGGPVLVNTDDTERGDERDPNDHDGREKDFNGQNIDVEAFRKAFRKDTSFCFNSGCNFDPRGLKVAQVVIQHPPRRPDKLFVVDEDRLTWDECRDEMKIALEENYSMALATAINRPVWGAGPGNGARVFSQQSGGRTRHFHKIATWHTITRAVMKEFQLKKNRQWYLRYLPLKSARICRK